MTTSIPLQIGWCRPSRGGCLYKIPYFRQFVNAVEGAFRRNCPNSAVPGARPSGVSCGCRRAADHDGLASPSPREMSLLREKPSLQMEKNCGAERCPQKIKAQGFWGPSSPTPPHRCFCGGGPGGAGGTPRPKNGAPRPGPRPARLFYESEEWRVKI